MNLKHLILFINCVWLCNGEENSNNSACEVFRYVNLIEDGKRDALAYKTPVDATKYRATKDKCFFNLFNSCLAPKTTEYGAFDFIVIGSGSAGSIVANRLSEVQNFSVLLLEAGGYENDFIDIPGMAFYAQGTEYNWGYTSEPQSKCCLGMVGKRCQFQRGRGIGGTTLINGLVYSRASAADYNRWASLGNAGWAYDDVLPFFIKSEAHQLGDSADIGYHGTDGLYNVEYANYSSPHIEAFLAANEELGNLRLDYNGRDHLGYSRAQLMTKAGRRQTTGAAFITPFLQRSNLNVSINSYVTKILIDKGMKAYGVEFTKNNRQYVAYAKKEVILSAGTIASPHILMHSGVGPKKHLEKFGIKSRQDLSVGENLQDHICIFGLTITTNTSIEVLPLNEYVKEYLNHRGVLTLPGGNAAVGFYKTNFSKYDSADLELIMVAANRTDGYFQKGYNFDSSTYAALVEGLDNPRSFSIYIYTLHPDSTGTVRLKSKDPFDYPAIDPHFLEDSEGYDIETLYYGIQIVESMLKTQAMRALDAQFLPVRLPQCGDSALFSKAYWQCFIRYTSDEIYHPVGTCRMGANPKDGAVVDNKLLVHGVRGLRVADASVIPFSMVGHTSAPAMMIGERVADFIKYRYNMV